MEDENLRKGPWYEEEDERLKAFVEVMGERRWDSIAKASGLKRSGKSCRLRWLNYLRPCLKQGPITPDEERVILQLHEKWGNKWAKIARRLPGRTDNEIKNYWRTHLRKKMQMQSALNYNNKVPSLATSSSSDQTNNSNQEISSSFEGECTNNFPDNVPCYNNNNNNNFKGLSDNYSITNSPFYENELSEWITRFSSEQSHELSSACWENNGLDYYPVTWSPGDTTSAWNSCPDTFWDIDLFTEKS